MQPIQEGSTGQLLRQRFKLTGQVQPVLDETVSPVILVGDLSIGALPAIRRVAVGQAVKGAVAAQDSAVRFKVPPGIVARITTVRMNTTAAASLVLVHFGDSLAGPFVAAATPPQYADGRIRTETPACSLDTESQAAPIAAPIVLNDAVSPALATFNVDWPIGGRDVEDHVEFQKLANNAAFRLVLEWIEYLPF